MDINGIIIQALTSSPPFWIQFSSLTPLSGIRIGSGPIHSRQLRGRVTGSGHWDLKKAAPCDALDRLSHSQLVVEANIRQIGSLRQGFGVKIQRKMETETTTWTASVGLVYLRTFTIQNQPNVGKYASPMDGTGIW